MFSSGFVCSGDEIIILGASDSSDFYVHNQEPNLREDYVQTACLHLDLSRKSGRDVVTLSFFLFTERRFVTSAALETVLPFIFFLEKLTVTLLDMNAGPETQACAVTVMKELAAVF